MTGPATSPNFVYRTSISLRRTVSTSRSSRRSRLVMLVSGPVKLEGIFV